MPIAVELIIYGRVQGVLFRVSAARRARTLGIKGWVRNETDGAVRIVAQGKKDALEKFASWCQKGPFLARVTKVNVTPREIVEEYNDFTIQ